MDDWREQVSRIEKSYEAIFSVRDAPDGNQDVLNIQSSELVKTYHGANRFPPRKRPTPLPHIESSKYEAILLPPSAPQPLDGEVAPPPIPQFEQIPPALVANLGNLLERLTQNRTEACKKGEYLLELPLTSPEGDAVHLSEVLLELRDLQEAAVELVGDIDALQFDRQGGETLESDSGLHSQAAAFCQYLRNDASASSLYLEGLVDLCEDMLYSPRGLTVKLDGIEPAWHTAESLHSMVASTPVPRRAAEYARMVSSKNLPMCNALYSFLCEPENHANILCISGYAFMNEAGREELKEILTLLITYGAPLGLSTGVSYVHELLLDGCSLTDADAHLLASYLPDFENLHSLSLRGNSLSSAGATSIATVLWENGLPLRVLQLDQNNITSDGAMMLGKALHRCRLLQRLSLSFNPVGDVGFYYLLRATMNKHRKLRHSLPRPEELYFDIDHMGEGDFDSDHEGSDDESDSDDDSDDGDDDAFTAVGDDESVYSHAQPYIPSHTMSRRGLIAAQKSNTELKKMKDLSEKGSKLQRVYRRLRCKIQAIAAFQRFRERGHNMHTLEMSGCGLGPFAVTCAAHALQDNHNLRTLILAENALGHSEFEVADNSAFVTLLVGSKLEHISFRNCGIFEHSLEAMIRAINKQNATLMSIDFSGNHLGPTGANMIASARAFYIDQLSLGIGYQPPPVLSRPPGGNSDRKASQRQHLILHKHHSHYDNLHHTDVDLDQTVGGVDASAFLNGEETFDNDNDFEGEDDQVFDDSMLSAEGDRRANTMTTSELQTDGVSESKGGF